MAFESQGGQISGILAPWLKFNFQTTLFSNYYHFDQPLPSWQPLYNEDEEMEFFAIPAMTY